MLKMFINFLVEYENKVVVLSKEASLAYFNASISGKEEDYKKASELQLQLSKIFSDKKDFEKLKEFKGSEEINNEQILKRQLDIIYNTYAGHQFDEKLQEEIINLSTKVEEKFSTFRACLPESNPDEKAQKLTDNKIDEVLENSTDSDELKLHWTASKQIGNLVADDIKQLVHLRNKAAKELGFVNYHQMSLELSEQNADDIEKLFDELDELTRGSFAKLKDEIDEYLSQRYSINKNELMPWHYQDKFFQQGPRIYKVDLDKYYKNKDIVETTIKYYNDIDLNIDDLIEKSDLFEKEGKYQHAYCTNIDRQGDVRVLCNVKSNYRWMGTMLHEYGHAVYDKYVNMNLPWTIREHAHIFTTEAIAMLFGRFASNPQWLKDVIGINDQEKEKISEDCYNSLRLEQLVFSRWVQVMYRFEKSMYENPGQDLNKLWWNLVEKYQMIKKPEYRNEPDWASKIHVALYPAYYHNYMLGELLASQLYYYITEKVIKSDSSQPQSFAENKNVGAYLKHLFFSYGAMYHWSELIKKATGEELTPKYYARQFVN
ncbi:MAG: peptidase M3 [Bacteroidetes bacterium]|nr:peptidase M3 [Bacteroidota bacterium]